MFNKCLINGYFKNTYGGVAQLARANGSYPLGRWFKSTRRYQSYGPLVKWPKTPPSHGGNTSSNLVRVTISMLSELYMFAITVNLDSDF